MTLPVLDLSATDAELARRLDDACPNVGFFAVVGHGVPTEAIDDAWAAMEAFFALAEATKLAARPDPQAAATEHRNAIPFFHQPNWDAEISAIETCVGPDRPRRHAPVLAGPRLAAKFDAASTGSE